jgi:hypothetical protein
MLRLSCLDMSDKRSVGKLARLLEDWERVLGDDNVEAR